MISKEDIIIKSRECGFGDVGFTTAEPFDTHQKYLADRQEEYGWAEAVGLDLMKGTDPRAIMADTQSVNVLMEVYFRKAYPRHMEGHFGRCYLDDDRVTKDGLSQRIKAFRSFLRDNAIDSKVPFNLPHRVAAARTTLPGRKRPAVGAEPFDCLERALGVLFECLNQLDHLLFRRCLGLNREQKSKQQRPKKDAPYISIKIVHLSIPQQLFFHRFLYAPHRCITIKSCGKT